MKPTQTISPPDWMTAPQTRAVMAALNDEGVPRDEGVPHDERAPQTMFVGGAVRNALLGKPVADIDLATLYTPPQVMERLKSAGIRYIPTGIDHGTVTAFIDGRSFEVTTLRRDVETDGRRAVIAFTTDWAEDAARRDFTMNTLLADAQGNIYDPLGQGLADLQAGRVIFVGAPAQRIAEDYLRILRFFRFHALYGCGDPDAAALAACREAASQIVKLSRERVTQEMMKILGVDDPTPTLMLMFAQGIAKDFEGAAFNQSLFSAFCRLQNQYASRDVPTRLALLANMDAGRAAALLMLSNAQIKELRAFIYADRDGVSLDERKIRDMVYMHGAAPVKQMLILRMAQEGESDLYRALFQIADTFNPPKFPLTGQDAMDLGIKPGAQLGQMLADAEHWWRAQDFVPDRQMCLRQLATFVAGSRQ